MQLKLENNYVILLTACVNPGNMPHTSITNQDIRLQSYIDALEFYTNKINCPIVFVENSGVDISNFIENKENIEFITFKGNNFDKKKGKGYGEGEIIKYAFQNSKILKECNNKLIIKITGRHIVNNIRTILQIDNILSIGQERVVAHIHKKSRITNSAMFIGSKKFFIDYFLANINNIDESKHIWFEHALYNAMYQYSKDKKGKCVNIPIELHKTGKCGSTGSTFKKPNLKQHITCIIKFVLYKLNIKKL